MTGSANRSNDFTAGLRDYETGWSRATCLVAVFCPWRSACPVATCAGPKKSYAGCSLARCPESSPRARRRADDPPRVAQGPPCVLGAPRLVGARQPLRAPPRGASALRHAPVPPVDGPASTRQNRHGRQNLPPCYSAGVNPSAHADERTPVQCASLSPMTQPNSPSMSSTLTAVTDSSPVTIPYATVRLAPMPTQTA